MTSKIRKAEATCSLKAHARKLVPRQLWGKFSLEGSCKVMRDVREGQAVIAEGRAPAQRTMTKQSFIKKLSFHSLKHHSLF